MKRAPIYRRFNHSAHVDGFSLEADGDLHDNAETAP